MLYIRTINSDTIMSPTCTSSDAFVLCMSFVTGIVQLHQDDELELVIPDRPLMDKVLISMDADATFFGVIQLN